MVFIRLVSAIETLSKFFKLSKKDDLFSGKEFDDVVKKDNLSRNERNELKKLFDVRYSRKKFVKLVDKHSKGFFKGGNYKAKHTKIKKEDLPKVLKTIYDARSDYLHRGEPMYLSIPMRRASKWDIDPNLGMIIDKRKIPKSKKLPYAYFLEGLVRHCLSIFFLLIKMEKAPFFTIPAFFNKLLTNS